MCIRDRYSLVNKFQNIFHYKLDNSITYLKVCFDKHAEALNKLRLILEEVEFDFGSEEDLRKDITETLSK